MPSFNKDLPITDFRSRAAGDSGHWNVVVFSPSGVYAKRIHLQQNACP